MWANQIAKPHETAGESDNLQISVTKQRSAKQQSPMSIHPFEPHVIKETLKMFPDELESPDIVYHGTSCAYSARIEAKGFEHGYRPWSSDDLKVIALAVSESHPKQSAEIRQWADHPVRLSFAKSSHLACQHAIAGGGGQTLGFIRGFRRCSGIMPEHLERVLAEVDDSDYCVYAVQVGCIPEASRSLEGGVLYVTSDVPREAVVGKIIIPKGTLLSAVKKPSLSDLYTSLQPNNPPT
jgi:hypothetical protein